MINKTRSSSLSSLVCHCAHAINKIRQKCINHDVRFWVSILVNSVKWHCQCCCNETLKNLCYLLGLTYSQKLLLPMKENGSKEHDTMVLFVLWQENSVLTLARSSHLCWVSTILMQILTLAQNKTLLHYTWQYVCVRKCGKSECDWSFLPKVTR